MTQAANLSEGKDAQPGDAGPAFDGLETKNKPPFERWTIGGKTYASTAELVKALPRLEKQQPVVYEFASERLPADRPAANKAINVVTGAIEGAGAGAFVYYALVISALLSENFLLNNPVLAGLLVAVFSVAGIFAHMSYWKKEGHVFDSMTGPAWKGKVYGGITYTEFGKPYFHLFDGNGVVNLAKHAEAPVTPAPVASDIPLARRALQLLGYAALGFVPLVGQVVGTQHAAELGKLLAHGTGLDGKTLGGALGAAAMLASFLAFTITTNPVFLALFLALSPALAVLSVLASNRMKKLDTRIGAKGPYGQGQWWWDRQNY